MIVDPSWFSHNELLTPILSDTFGGMATPKSVLAFKVIPVVLLKSRFPLDPTVIYIFGSPPTQDFLLGLRTKCPAGERNMSPVDSILKFPLTSVTNLARLLNERDGTTISVPNNCKSPMLEIE